MVEIPQNWPSSVKYLSTDNEWHPKTTAATRDLFTGLSQPGSVVKQTLWTELKSEIEEGTLPVLSFAPRRMHQLVHIVSLEASHPCYQEDGSARGLFAAKTLKPKSYLFDYMGCYVHDDLLDGHAISQHRDVADIREEESDYVLLLHDELNIDAGRIGNEARFINDYRGIATKPNVYFETYYDPTMDMLRAGVFSMQASILPGEELVTTYGVENYWSLDANMSQIQHDTKDQQEWQNEWDQ